eukprot:gb/GECG01013693.1/.p1 GENE.gb/GECG01013693.1/~~gb/GECG01013693.1/.p1  ORF type:complete len:1023 (+),score=198.27 gb/GECG01013693.1/:1-3069(+)
MSGTKRPRPQVNGDDGQATYSSSTSSKAPKHLHTESNGDDSGGDESSLPSIETSDDEEQWAQSFVNTVEAEGVENIQHPKHPHYHDDDDDDDNDKQEQGNDKDAMEKKLEEWENQPRRGGREWQSADGAAASGLPIKQSNTGKIIHPSEQGATGHPREMLHFQQQQQQKAAGGDGAVEGGQQQEQPDKTEEEEEEERQRQQEERKRQNIRKSKQARIENIIQNLKLDYLSETQLVKRREKRKREIAKLAEKILEKPESNICTNAPSSVGAGKAVASTLRRCNRMLDLHEICYDGDLIVRKLAILSELRVVKDILPGYRIQLPQAQENVQLKKEVKRLREFERDLLVSFERYLDFLEATLKAYDQADALANAPPLDDKKIEALKSGEWDQFEEETPHSIDSLMKKKAHQRRAAKGYLGELQQFRGTNRQIQSLGVTAIRALCELLEAAYHFNYRERLVAIIVSRANHKSEELARPCISCINTICEEDVSCAACVDIVKQVRELVKSVGVNVRRELIECLCNLPLKTLQRDSKIQQAEKKKIKAALAKKTKKEDAKDIMSSLKAADAEDRDERIKNQTECLKQVMVIYLKLLRSENNAHVLSPILDGIGKFSALIDVQVAEDVVLHLKDLVERDCECETAEDDLLAASLGSEVATEWYQGTGRSTGQPKDQVSGDADKVLSQKKVSKILDGSLGLPIDASIKLVETAFHITGGSGRILNSDESIFANYLYRILLRLVAPLPSSLSAGANGEFYIRAITSALIKRKDIEISRVAAFVKRLCLVASHVPAHVSLAFLSLARELLSAYPGAQATLSSEAEKVGSGNYDLDGLDMTQTSANGLAATLWELAALGRHFNPAVRAFAIGTANGNSPSLGMGPTKLLQSFDFTQSCTFNPSIPSASPHPLDKKCSSEWKHECRSVNGNDSHSQEEEKDQLLDPLSHDVDLTEKASGSVEVAAVNGNAAYVFATSSKNGNMQRLRGEVNDVSTGILREWMNNQVLPRENAASDESLQSVVRWANDVIASKYD